METLNPWGWGGPRAHCPTSWVSTLILRLLQERRALTLLSPPPPAALKRRKQLRLHSWRAWSCERKVGVFPAHLQDWAPQGTPVPLCLAVPDCSGAAWAKPEGTQRAEPPRGLGGGRRGLGIVIFWGCWNFLKSFLSGVISKHWGSSGKTAFMKPLNRDVGTTSGILVPPNTRIPLRDMLFCSQTTERSYRGVLMQGSDHVEQLLTWTSGYWLKITGGLQHTLGLKYVLKWIKTLGKT